MLDDDKTNSDDVTEPTEGTTGTDEAPAKTTKKAAAKKSTTKKAPAKKTTAKKSATSTSTKTAAKKTTAKKTAAKKTTASKTAAAEAEPPPEGTPTEPESGAGDSSPVPLLFQAPEVPAQPKRTRKAAPSSDERDDTSEAGDTGEAAADTAAGSGDEGESGDSEQTAARRRRRRGGRRRRKAGDGEATDEGSEGATGEEDDSGQERSDDEQGEGSGTRRRRRRRREGDKGGGGDSDDPDNTTTKVRKARSPEDEITAVTGSTRLEAKKQRRREGREAGRRRAPIVSEAEFLARRESVDRAMVIRQRDDLTQIAVLEDKVLVEHYVARESQSSLIGNVYVGRVQNVLPSMEAAFIDIGKGRNAVLYAGEVNWSALGHKDGQPRKIESVLSSGQSVLVQVTKDPIGHKGARLTSQVSLAGRFLVYVPDGTTSGISRKLPDTERNRLKTLLKEIVPDTAGVIVRTAAEGASEDELTRDVERLKARWEDIESKAKSGNAPKLLYGEPDLTLKVVRDLFTEDFTKLVIQGEDAWDTVEGYVAHVAPDLEDRLERFDAEQDGDAFSSYRIDEQIAKGMDRKVWLPSGGSLVIDRTEAMTVVDVNTGKFTGSGGNLEETVTKNNLEAAEEIVRQLRLRDIGGIIVVDFIDMVLESNRDLVLRRLVECLGRDRTRHQVAEVTSLGLVQMTRKRIGTGLLEAFSESCEHCDGRGLVVHDMPVEPKRSDDADRRGRRGRGRGGAGGGNGGGRSKPVAPTPKDVAAVAKPENADKPPIDEVDASEPVIEPEPAPVVDEVEAPSTEVPEEPSAEEPAELAPEEPGVEEPAAEESAAPAAEEAALGSEEPAAPAAEESVEAPAPALEEVAPAPEIPAAPKVVTRSRRVARRPAGSAASAPAQPVVVEQPAPDAEPVPVAPAPVVEPPKVVTRTRRVVSRPAGAAEQPDGSEPGGADAAEHEVPESELHVPIKKKGSRKR